MIFSLETLLDIFYGWIGELVFLWNFISTPLGDIVPKLSLGYGALAIFGLTDLSIAYLMLGGGIMLFVAYTVAKWLFGLIT